MPVLLDKTVWDGEGVRSCRAAALPSPLLYISHTHPKLVSYSKGSFPKADHDLLCSLRGNSLIYRNCFSETPATIECASEPGATTCIRRMYLQAVLGRFQNARCIMVVRSSPTSACDMTPTERKECMEFFIYLFFVPLLRSRKPEGNGSFGRLRAGSFLGAALFSRYRS